MPVVRVEKHNYTAEPFYQWDRNQVLEIYGLSLPSTPEVHFYNNTMDRAIVRQATMNSAGVITVSVPNGLLQKPYTITAHLCIYTGATFKTQYTVKLPVTPRTQPADYTLEDDDDVYSFNELSNKVEQTVAELKAAEARFNASVDEIITLTGERLIDASLSQTGKAADAKAVSEAIAEEAKNMTTELYTRCPPWSTDEPVAPINLTPGEVTAKCPENNSSAENSLSVYMKNSGQLYLNFSTQLTTVVSSTDISAFEIAVRRNDDTLLSYTMADKDKVNNAAHSYIINVEKGDILKFFVSVTGAYTNDAVTVKNIQLLANMDTPHTYTTLTEGEAIDDSAEIINILLGEE